MADALAEEIAQQVVGRLVASGLTVATAESLTGGRVAARLTGVPGSSATFLGGVVTYATSLKVSLLGVPESLVAEHGVVSAQVAAAMADGVRRLTGADLAVATTGVAGPGPQDGVPAGTVWLGGAWGGSRAETVTERLALTGGRHDVQQQACRLALSVLAAMLDDLDPTATHPDLPREEPPLG